MQELYAQAIARLSAKGMAEGDIVTNLVAQLKRSGRMKLLPGILRELKIAESRATFSGVTLEVAREDEKADALAAAKAEGIEATDASINPALIRGWRARSGGTLIDRSGKRALVDLYARIVK